MAADLKFGIPDIQLGCALGTKISPAAFIGHELIVLFCPLDPSEAERELAAYHHHCADFVDHDAWLLAFAEHFEDLAADGAGRIMTIPDTERHAWVAFRDLTGHPEEFDRSSGATFLFTRAGRLHRCWHGPGHVEDVIEELQTPAFHHLHQRTASSV